MGNILYLSGVTLIIGPTRSVRFFFQRRKAKASVSFFTGMAVVLAGWPMIGMALELFGFVNLFGDFFPVVIAFLRRAPIAGNILALPGIRNVRLSVIFLLIILSSLFFSPSQTDHPVKPFFLSSRLNCPALARRRLPTVWLVPQRNFRYDAHCKADPHARRCNAHTCQTGKHKAPAIAALMSIICLLPAPPQAKLGFCKCTRAITICLFLCTSPIVFLSLFPFVIPLLALHS